MPVYFASTGPVSCQCWYRYWASTLRQYWPNAEPLLPQHWANTACRYWASTGPIHCASTGPMLDQHWPNTGAVPHTSIGPIHSRCAAYALGQCRLYRPASIGPVLAQYCHVCWGIMEPITRSKRVRPSDIVIHYYLFYFILL